MSLADIFTTDKEVKVTVEMLGISKQDTKVSVYEDAVELSTSENTKRKYHRIIDLPSETDIETAKSTYSNGILDITYGCSISWNCLIVMPLIIIYRLS